MPEVVCRDPNYWWARCGLVTGDGVRMNVFGSLIPLSICMSSLVCGKTRRYIWQG